MNCAMLAVDRYQFGASRRTERLDDGSAGDQALLVGQCQALAHLQGAHRDGEPRKADDTVDDDVGVIGEISEIADDFRERQGCGDFGSLALIRHRNDLRSELVGLRDEGIDGRANTEGNDFVAAGFGSDDIEGLYPDRARRAGNCDAHR